jgi:hypothetical protein
MLISLEKDEIFSWTVQEEGPSYNRKIHNRTRKEHFEYCKENSFSVKM